MVRSIAGQRSCAQEQRDKITGDAYGWARGMGSKPTAAAAEEVLAG